MNPCARSAPEAAKTLREARPEQRERENDKERSKTASKSRKKKSGGRASRTALRAKSQRRVGNQCPGHISCRLGCDSVTCASYVRSLDLDYMDEIEQLASAWRLMLSSALAAAVSCQPAVFLQSSIDRRPCRIYSLTLSIYTLLILILRLSDWPVAVTSHDTSITCWRLMWLRGAPRAPPPRCTARRRPRTTRQERQTRRRRPPAQNGGAHAHAHSKRLVCACTLTD
jgi:hypothetical protein